MAGAGPGLQNRGDGHATPHRTREIRQAPADLAAQGQRPAPQDPDLAVVVAAWPDLSEALRAAIAAMVTAAKT
jgi:hypothetical protein